MTIMLSGRHWLVLLRRRWRHYFSLGATAPALSGGTVAGRSMRVMRRFHLGATLALLACTALLVLLLVRQVHRADAAMDTALLAARQPALALRLAALDGRGEELGQRQAFADTLRQMEGETADLFAHAATSAVPLPAELRALLTGPGYALRPRLDDLFALAHRLRQQPAGAEAEAASLVAGLRREIVEQVVPLLATAAEMFRAHAADRLRGLTGDLALAAAASAVLPLLWLLVSLSLDARLRHRLGLLEWLAARDALTGALTRGAFTARLHSLLAEATPQAGVAVASFDLDNFRAINAGNGDAAGDAALRAVARRLRQAAGPAALVARLGSDSFSVALPGLTGGDAAAQAATERLAAALRAPIPFDGQMLLVSASGGTALAPQDSTDRSELLRMAGTALREAKRENKGSVRMFRIGDPAAQARRQTLLRALTAGDLRGLVPWLQPLVRCSDGTPLRFEVLARWEHPTLGRLSPAEFLPVAEAVGRLPMLSAHVRNAAFMAMAELEASLASQPALGARLPPDLGLAVNFAVSEMAMPDTLPNLRAALEAAGLAPHRLTIEVTEEMLVGVMDEAAQESLQALRQQGVRLNLDNFGTGYANLAHLHRFPVDGLKIARPFIAAIGQDPRAEAVLRGVVGLGRGLAIETVAEGVETAAQLAFMREAGCDTAQGYLMGAPMPFRDIPTWLARPRPAG